MARLGRRRRNDDLEVVTFLVAVIIWLAYKMIVIFCQLISEIAGKIIQKKKEKEAHAREMQIQEMSHREKAEAFDMSFPSVDTAKAKALMNDKDIDKSVSAVTCPKKCLVGVYFPEIDAIYTYYNDSFDLKLGDLVYVNGKLNGSCGEVKEIDYSFKIRVSDYKKVIVKVDTKVEGDMFLAGTHLVAIDRNVIPYEKALGWFALTNVDNEFICGDESMGFPLEDLSQMHVRSVIAQRGFEYFSEKRVVYMEFDRGKVRAIVHGSEYYIVDCDYRDGIIYNMFYSCCCFGRCKHEVAVLLQLYEIIQRLEKQYSYTDDYFAIIDRQIFYNKAVSNKTSGRLTLV